jgi:hypothetical protein
VVTRDTQTAHWLTPRWSKRRSRLSEQLDANVSGRVGPETWRVTAARTSSAVCGPPYDIAAVESCNTRQLGVTHVPDPCTSPHQCDRVIEAVDSIRIRWFAACLWNGVCDAHPARRMRDVLQTR